MTCEHPHEELRKRTVRNGALQYVSQCLTCGKATSQAIPKATAIKAFPVNDFDEDLMMLWAMKVEEDFEIKAAMKKKEFDEWYADYLESSEWAEIRVRVFQRDNQRCQGCLTGPAEVVHHHEYRNVGEEFLFQLTSLCRKCHDRYHPEEV